ncbi:hypothetical protein [Massilia jejuensis]|uniref:hypothetical protein n=1 Tax=Massilia jejuensis TaxID=648894 RepID=UPI0036D34BBB
MKASQTWRAFCARLIDHEAERVQSVKDTLLRCTILVKIKNGKAGSHRCAAAPRAGPGDRALQRMSSHGGAALSNDGAGKGDFC